MNKTSESNDFSLNQMLGSSKRALVFCDQKVNLPILRLAVELMARGAAQFAGFAVQPDTRCVGLIASHAERDIYTLAAPSYLADQSRFALSEATPALGSHDTFAVGTAMLAAHFTGNVVVTVKAPPLARQPDRWAKQLEAIANALPCQDFGCIVFADCPNPEQLDALPIGYSNALLVTEAEADGAGFAFALRAHRGGVLAALNYRPTLVQVQLANGEPQSLSTLLVATDALTRKMVAARNGGQSLQTIADAYGINKSTVHRRLASAGLA